MKTRSPASSSKKTKPTTPTTTSSPSRKTTRSSSKTKTNSTSPAKESSPTTPPPKTLRKKRPTTTETTKPDAPITTRPLALAPPTTTTPTPTTPRLTKPPPAVDVTVHRLRHLNFHPKPILCICPTAAASGGLDTLIAVSRSNGTVELRHARQKMRTVAVVAGIRHKPVQAMAWITTTTTTTTSTSETTTAASLKKPNQSNPLRYRTLIGASRDGSIFVIDFIRGQLTSVTPSGGGGVFGLSPLSGGGDSNNNNNNNNNNNKRLSNNVVAAGCEDGSIRFFRVVHDDNNKSKQQLELVSTIPSAGAAVLALTWTTTTTCMGNYHHHETTKPNTKRGGSMMDLSGTTIFASVADGTIRRYDSSVEGNSSTLGSTAAIIWKSTLRMTVECLGRTTPTRVWALATLQDGTIVSGDSLGHVQFWDGHTGTLQASFDQNDYKADVLSLAVSRDQTKVFASGVDSRVVCMERPALKQQDDTTAAVVSSNNNNIIRPWALTNAHRPHTHDVQAVAIYVQPKKKGGSSGGTEVLCTGGLDTKLCTYAVNDFSRKRPQTIYPWPSKSPVSVAATARILTMMREDRIEIYDLAPRPSTTSELTAPILVNEGDKLVGTVHVQSPYNLAGSCVSNDGRFMAFSDVAKLLIFQLEFKTQEGREPSSTTRTVTPTRVALLEELPAGTSVVAMKFVQNNRLVVSCSSGVIHVIALNEIIDKGDGITNATAHVVQTIQPTPEMAGNPSLLPMDTIVSSVDGSWFATSRNIAAAGAIEVYHYQDTNDDDDNDEAAAAGRYLRWWLVPELDSPQTAVGFLAAAAHSSESTGPQLVVACVNYASYVFDVEKRCLSRWSESAGFPVSLPDDLVNRSDYPDRIGTNPANNNQFFMGSFGAMVVVDTSRPFPNACRHVPESHVRGKKRKRAASLTSGEGQQQQQQQEEHPTAKNNEVEAKEESTCTLCLRYNSMLYMDFVSSNEMVIVEQPWLSVVATFPEALQRSVYGS